jgi:hypothetical protein
VISTKGKPRLDASLLFFQLLVQQLLDFVKCGKLYIRYFLLSLNTSLSQQGMAYFCVFRDYRENRKAMTLDKEQHSMDTLLNLLKNAQIGTWCKRAAWVILGIGLFQAASSFYLLSQLPNFSWPFLTLSQFLVMLRFVLDPLPSILFYFFILYTVGAIISHFTDNLAAAGHDRQ